MPASAARLIKPYLKKVVLKVHPDFFVKEPIKKQHNAAALQQLYTILQPVLRPEQPSTSPKRPDAPMSLSFYLKGASSMNPSVMFTSPRHVWPIVHDFLILCQQLHVPVNAMDLAAVQQTLDHQKRHTNPRSLHQEFATALYQQEQRRAGQPTHWTPAMILEQPLLMCDPSIDQQRLANHLAQWLPQLTPHQWWGRLPTLVVPANTHPLPDHLCKGILVLHDSMTPKDIQAYLDTHLQRKLKEYQDQD
ncbi:hypothetical protein DM01DRAFT_1408291 [Hesseltinella vesiculosa]|uniref:DUF4460 domain-containing protein n=1 Tax=Hesseltinella vesiculosa TaxID=101127 RepID=A0A1X2GF79_9FUNG|nr:hypothetical protein DM01DRAFT_1408291 [Hesseltinella vesiculosa]